MKHLTALLLYTSAFAATTNAISLSVASSGGNATSRLQYGLIFEDISHSGDGGIYAELIMNRAFQAVNSTSATLDPWRSINGATLELLDTQGLSEPLPNSVAIVPSATQQDGNEIIGLENPGFWGMDVKPQTYVGSFWIKGSYDGNFTAALRSNSTGDVWASTAFSGDASSTGWRQLNFTLTPTAAAPDSNNSFAVMFNAGQLRGTDGVAFTLLSLFPPTYKNRRNGMRIDLMQALADLKPSFLRLPGGNNLEGYYPSQWMWNETVGALRNRPGFPGAWGYFNTYGLGLAEYLNWCNDLDMEPVLAVWDGFWLGGPAIAESALNPYVQDTLNELEYIMGSTSTTYGAMRAADGFPDPWTIKFVEVGNEDNLGGGFASYEAYRFNAYYTAIKNLYPDISIISSTSALKLPALAVGDYHQYSRPDQLVSQFNYFDQNASSNPTLVGEYSAYQPNIPQGGGADFSMPSAEFPFWIGTVAEAVFNIGAERNAPAMLGTTYAPILQNLNNFQWTPDLISFTADPSQTVFSTSYQMLKLFSGTRITQTRPVNTTDAFGPVYWVAGENTDSNSHILKAAVYNSTGDVPMKVAFDGVAQGAQATLTVLTSADPLGSAKVGINPVSTNTTTLTSGPQGFSFDLPNLSVALLLTL